MLQRTSISQGDGEKRGFLCEGPSEIKRYEEKDRDDKQRTKTTSLIHQEGKWRPRSCKLRKTKGSYPPGDRWGRNADPRMRKGESGIHTSKQVRKNSRGATWGAAEEIEVPQRKVRRAPWPQKTAEARNSQNTDRVGRGRTKKSTANTNKQKKRLEEELKPGRSDPAVAQTIGLDRGKARRGCGRKGRL